MADERTYPHRPFLAVSAAIIRHDKVLLVRRARKPALHLYTLPGGAVEAGETLREAVVREAQETLWGWTPHGATFCSSVGSRTA